MKIEKMIQEEVLSLENSDITVKQHKAICDKINTRFYYIVQQIFKANSCKMSWCDFDNEGGNERSPGSFDIARYKEDIGFTGESARDSHWLNYYSDSFPTRWLWEDFELELKTEIAKEKEAEAAAKQKIKDQKVAKNQIRHEMIATINAKLSDDERKWFNKNLRKAK